MKVKYEFTAQKWVFDFAKWMLENKQTMLILEDNEDAIRLLLEESNILVPDYTWLNFVEKRLFSKIGKSSCEELGIMGYIVECSLGRDVMAIRIGRDD